jgi:hypothetical protein
MALIDWTKIKQERATDMKHLRSSAVVREDTALTTSYVTTDEVDISEVSGVGIFFNITQGTRTSFQYKVQQQIDSVWYDEGSEQIGTTTSTDGAHEYSITLSTDTPYYKLVHAVGERMRLSVKATGGAGGSVAVTLVGVY